MLWLLRLCICELLCCSSGFTMAPKKDARLKTLQELATYVPCSHYGLGIDRSVKASFCNRDPSLEPFEKFFLAVSRIFKPSDVLMRR